METCDHCEDDGEDLHYCVEGHLYCSEHVSAHNEGCALGCTAPHDCEA